MRDIHTQESMGGDSMVTAWVLTHRFLFCVTKAVDKLSFIPRFHAKLTQRFEQAGIRFYGLNRLLFKSIPTIPRYISIPYITYTINILIRKPYED